MIFSVLSRLCRNPTWESFETRDLWFGCEKQVRRSSYASRRESYILAINPSFVARSAVGCSMQGSASCAHLESREIQPEHFYSQLRQLESRSICFRKINLYKRTCQKLAFISLPILYRSFTEAYIYYSLIYTSSFLFS